MKKKGTAADRIQAMEQSIRDMEAKVKGQAETIVEMVAFSHVSKKGLSLNLDAVAGLAAVVDTLSRLLLIVSAQVVKDSGKPLEAMAGDVEGWLSEIRARVAAMKEEKESGSAGGVG